MTAFAVFAALTAACTFGLSSVLMFRAAQTTTRPPGAWNAWAALGRSRLWWAGAGLQVVSFVVQASALAFGPLALVQPLAATDLLFAFPFLARSRHRRMQRREWSGALLVAFGVGVFLGVSPPRAGLTTASAGDWLIVVVAVSAIVVAASVTGKAVKAPVAQTTLLSVAGSADFALVDALSKNFVGHLHEHGILATLGSWEPYLLAAAGCVGLALSQAAFRSGALQISLPVIDTLEPTLAVLIGTVVFHEALAAPAFTLGVQLAGAAVALAGIVILDRSPVTASDAERSSGSALADEGPVHTAR